VVNHSLSRVRYARYAITIKHPIIAHIAAMIGIKNMTAIISITEKILPSQVTNGSRHNPDHDHKRDHDCHTHIFNHWSSPPQARREPIYAALCLNCIDPLGSAGRRVVCTYGPATDLAER